jgi:hypothetical protein
MASSATSSGHQLLGEVGIGRKLGEDADDVARCRLVDLGYALQHIVCQHHAALVTRELGRTCLEDRKSRIAFRPVELDHEAAAEARANVGAKPFQGRRRQRCSDHHASPQVCKCVDGVEEFGCRRGRAADVLQVVDDQHFGRAQLFLEGKRILAIERAQEVGA